MDPTELRDLKMALKKPATAGNHLATVTIWLGLIASSFALCTSVHAEGNARGEQLFDLCAQCHGPAGGGMQLSLAPAIAGLDEWYVVSQLNVFRSGARGKNPKDVGGMRMHPMSLWLRSDSDVKAVAAFVASLPRTNPEPVVEGGDATTGSQLYAACSACHGPKGEGDQTKNSPPLVGQSDWYVLSTMQKYKAGIRGANPGNPNAVLMRGMSNILTTDQAVLDVIAHIQTLDH
jgi:cytochrome c oxidase subunit 2